MSNQDFINQVVPGAKEGYTKYGILPSVTIAQAINESGWGKSKLASTDNNLFGIKFPGNHSPDVSVTRGTWATDDGGYYAHYGSWSASIIDHGYFLKNNSRYASAIGLKDASAQVKAIANAGYATESDYYQVTMEIIKDNNLTQYDAGGYTGSSSASGTQTITIPSTNYAVVSGSQKQGEILYGRRYRVTVTDSQGNGFDVSKLRCTFNVIKTIQMEPNMSEITIYNLNAQTENNIEMYAKRITLEAGYEGNQYGLIFDGDILQTVRDKPDSATYRLTIIALDSDRAINFDIANYSVLRGQTARTIVDHIINKAQYPVSLGSISESLKSAPSLTRGKVFFGKSSDYLHQIADSNGCKYYTEDGKVNLIKLTDMPKDEIFDLTPKNGLIGTPEQSDYGVNGQCLLNPRIKVNSLIHIDNSLVRAKKISITGNNSVPASSSSGGANATRQKILDEAKKICDDPNVQYSQAYRGQTVGGITYWDCSSFVKHCYEVAGLSIVDITGPQYNQVASGGKFVSQSEAIPGDLVFWGTGSSCYHVAIYAGNGHIYAARGRDGKAPADQVAYTSLYGSPSFGRPKCLTDADSGNPPSASSSTNTGSDGTAQTPVYRSLDKDGIYRVIKVTYEGDTRGDNWYVDFETIDQVGGAIPITAI